MNAPKFIAIQFNILIVLSVSYLLSRGKPLAWLRIAPVPLELKCWLCWGLGIMENIQLLFPLKLEGTCFDLIRRELYSFSFSSDNSTSFTASRLLTFPLCSLEFKAISEVEFPFWPIHLFNYHN